MDVPLNIPRGARQQALLDYMNAALRISAGSYSGMAGVDGDGTFRSSVTGPFRLGERTVPLTWEVIKAADGTLTKLSITSTEGDDWEKPAYEFVTSILATTLAGTLGKYFRRAMFFHIGTQVDGEYWLPGYRFGPMYPEDPFPHLVNAERVVAIDQEVAATDDAHAHMLAMEAARRHAARLSLLLNAGLYPPDHTQRWVWPTVDGRPAEESVRMQLGFNRAGAYPGTMPEKASTCPLGKYRGSLTMRYRAAGELMSLPPQARRILRGVDNSPPLIADAFDRGARLYQVGLVCGQHFPSVALAYRVAAVEVMSRADPTTNGFSEFMRKYVRSEKNLDDLLKYSYGTARSGHFHGGEFPFGEFSRGDYMGPLFDSDQFHREGLFRVSYELTREAIVNWLFDVVAEPDGHPDELQPAA
jgi:hypothetical protein